MRLILLALVSSLIRGCTAATENQPGQLSSQFEDGKTELLGVIDCSNIGGPEYERNCLEQAYSNREAFDKKRSL